MVWKMKTLSHLMKLKAKLMLIKMKMTLQNWISHRFFRKYPSDTPINWAIFWAFLWWLTNVEVKLWNVGPIVSPAAKLSSTWELPMKVGNTLTMLVQIWIVLTTATHWLHPWDTHWPFTIFLFFICMAKEMSVKTLKKLSKCWNWPKTKALSRPKFFVKNCTGNNSSRTIVSNSTKLTLLVPWVTHFGNEDLVFLFWDHHHHWSLILVDYLAKMARRILVLWSPWNAITLHPTWRACLTTSIVWTCTSLFLVSASFSYCYS